MTLLTKNISIVGSGPSGLYTAYHLIKKAHVKNIPISIKIWEKFPVPFGLSRFGVAPDHPEVKNCELTFKSMFQDYKEMSQGFCKDLQFIGNTKIGTFKHDSSINSFQNNISLKELIDTEDIVVLSYGCNGDRKLNIENEDNCEGVFTSRQFVNWYNGQFDMALNQKFLKFDWSKVKNVGIIGNGNVALDIARVLISNQIDELWSSTDISNVALECLRKAPIESIRIFGRRDFLQSKFTNKELRELWELERFGIYGNINSEQFNQISQNSKNNAFDRPTIRRIEMCKEYMSPFNERTKKNYKKIEPPITREQSSKKWEFDYLKSPTRINKDSDSNTIKSLTVSKNVLKSDTAIISEIGNSTEQTYDMDLLITSLGYKGEPLDEFSKLDIKFDGDHIGNDKGRVLSTTGQVIPRLYASGWIRNGSRGVIANTMQDAFQVGDEILTDLQVLPVRDETHKLHLDRIQNITSWQDWNKIDAKEIENGIQYGKQRLKYLTIDEIMNQLKVKA